MLIKLTDAADALLMLVEEDEAELVVFGAAFVLVEVLFLLLEEVCWRAVESDGILIAVAEELLFFTAILFVVLLVVLVVAADAAAALRFDDRLALFPAANRAATAACLCETKAARLEPELVDEADGGLEG